MNRELFHEVFYHPLMPCCLGQSMAKVKVIVISHFWLQHVGSLPAWGVNKSTVALKTSQKAVNEKVNSIQAWTRATSPKLFVWWNTAQGAGSTNRCDSTPSAEQFAVAVTTQTGERKTAAIRGAKSYRNCDVAVCCGSIQVVPVIQVAKDSCHSCKFLGEQTINHPQQPSNLGWRDQSTEEQCPKSLQKHSGIVQWRQQCAHHEKSYNVRFRRLWHLLEQVHPSQSYSSTYLHMFFSL